VIQALHIAQRGADHLMKPVISAITNDCQQRPVSATHSGAKTTTRTYAGYTYRSCARRAANLTAALWPLSRPVVDSYLDPVATRRSARSER